MSALSDEIGAMERRNGNLESALSELASASVEVVVALKAHEIAIPRRWLAAAKIANKVLQEDSK